MNLKITSAILAVVFYGNHGFAQRLGGGGGDRPSRGNGGGGDGRSPFQGGGDGGDRGGERPFGGGGPRGDGLPGFPGREDIDLVDINDVCTPAAEDTCALRNGQDGVFVCRSRYAPLTGDLEQETKCIASDKAWSTDDCGCCEDECPEQPDFEDLPCNPDDQAALDFGGRERDGDDSDIEKVIICRSLFNPFDGQELPTTIRVPINRGLDGDVCGCCDGVCPSRGEDRFPRPDLVTKSCGGLEDDGPLIPCTIKRKGKKGGYHGGRGDHHGRGGLGDGFRRILQDDVDGDTDADREGFFVSRTYYNPITGESDQEVLCIDEDRAWATDVCGCGADECPEEPETTELDCTKGGTVEPETCARRNGQEGSFVCRSLFHPLDGSIVERTLCLETGEEAWVTDTCGCCLTTGCPDAPDGSDGVFDDEDTQLVSFALENGEDESGATERRALITAGTVGLLGVIMMAI